MNLISKVSATLFLTVGLLTATEKWQNMFKNTAIDVYVGAGKDPVLTATGFKNGEYISSLTNKPNHTPHPIPWTKSFLSPFWFSSSS